MTYRMSKFLSSQASATRNVEAANALNAEADANWGDRKWHREQASIIARSVDLGFANPAVFGGVLKFSQLGPTDVLRSEIRNGIVVRDAARGAYVDESDLKTVVTEDTRRPMAWHVVGEETDVLKDYAASLDELIRLATMAEQVEVVRRQLGLLQTAIPSTSPYYVDASSGGLTPTVLKSAVVAVMDAPRADGGITPQEVTIMGRATAISEVADFAGFGLLTLDEINNQGYMGHYRGARVVNLQNYVDAAGNSFMPDNEVWVVSEGAGEFATYGPAIVRQWAEEHNGDMHTVSWRTAGGGIWFPQRIRRIKIS